MAKQIKKLYRKQCENYVFGIFLFNAPTYSGRLILSNNVKGEREILFKPKHSIEFDKESLKKIVKIIEKEEKKYINKK